MGNPQKEHIQKHNLNPPKHHHLNKDKTMWSHEEATTHVGECGNIETKRHERVKRFEYFQGRR